MTRAELIAALDAAGVQDDDEVRVLDLPSCCDTDIREIVVEIDMCGQRTAFINAE